MSSEARNDGGSCRRSAETGAQVDRRSVDFSIDGSHRTNALDRRSQSFGDGHAFWSPHGSVGPNGKGYTERGADFDVSPPPRPPLAFTLGGNGFGVRQQSGYAAHFYEESDGDGDEEDANGSGDDEWEDEEEYEESHAGEEDCDDEELSKGGSAENDRAASEVFFQGARALRFDFDEGTVAPSADAHIAGGLGFRTAQQTLPHALGQGSVGAPFCAVSAAKAAPGTKGSFRRATPVARAAYSVGYDRAAGESSEHPASASSPRGKGATVWAGGSFKQTSLAPATTDTLGDATQDGPKVTVEARPLRDSTGDTTLHPSAGACHTSAASVVLCEAGGRAPAHRRCGSSGAVACGEGASESLQGHVKTKKSTKEPMLSTPDHQYVSTTSSPLSPQRPTIEAIDELHDHRCSGNAFPTGFGNTVAPIVLALGEVADAQNSGDEPSGNDAEKSVLSLPTEPSRESVAVSAVPLQTMISAVVAPDELIRPFAAGRGCCVENLLKRCEYSTTAADIQGSACEQEEHVRSSPNMAVLPVRGISPLKMMPISTGQIPAEVLASGEIDAVDETANDSVAARNREMPYTPAKSGVPPVHAPTVTLSVFVSNVFNYSEAERMWLSCGQWSAFPARAMQVPGSVTDSNVSPPTSGALGKTLPHPSDSEVKVSLYYRPLLVQLPSPSLRTSLLCAAGNSTLVKAILACLCYVSLVLVPTLLQLLVSFTLTLFCLAALLAAMDAAFRRWAIGSFYPVEMYGSPTAWVLSVLGCLSFPDAVKR
ncbi:hypothetical protein CUR178_02699 [Leishmania enriettii]|uniref:Transmembrane protein n=1 Tax=Leishmania enriettii TaxID=5663 RepID=A0A836H8I9_LEIEN|nr:hypothetical protein CUR178_02699 [Leishmania enriettii]